MGAELVVVLVAWLVAVMGAGLVAGLGGEGLGAVMGVGLGAGLVAGLGEGLVLATGAVMGILYLRGNFLDHYFPTTALDSLLLIGAVLLAWLVLSLVSVLLSARFLPWFRVSKQAAHRLCQRDYHRFRLEPGLPWPVRWSGRLLMVEEPRQHQDFADYFVCRYCGQRNFVTAKRLIGVIGAMPSATASGELSVSLFNPDSRQACSADIDRLDLYPPLPDQTLDYDYAVNSVLNALSEDHHRSRALKKIPVRIHDQLSLPENTRRMLADRFTLLTS
jgi:hypothetical protein